MRTIGALLVVAAVLGAGCADSSDDAGSAVTSPATSAPPVESTVLADQRFPDVVGAEATTGANGWRFDVTISSPYDTPERYADAWRVVAPDGTVLGVRELAHDHQFEQPFTRSLGGVEIPDAVTSVTIEGRDSANGWGGATVQVDLDDR